MNTLLLIQTSQGATVAVRFPSVNAALDWEEAHPEIQGLGCAMVVSKSEAVRLS